MKPEKPPLKPDRFISGVPFMATFVDFGRLLLFVFSASKIVLDFFLLMIGFEGKSWRSANGQAIVRRLAWSSSDPKLFSWSVSIEAAEVDPSSNLGRRSFFLEICLQYSGTSGLPPFEVGDALGS